MRADWADFYEGMADRIGKFTGAQLYEKIQSLSGTEAFVDYMHFEDTELWDERGRELDPFTVMGIFNRGQSDEHRFQIGSSLAELFNLGLQAPRCYHGIPYIDPRRSIYEGHAQMWALFKASLDGPQAGNFASAYDAAQNERGNALGNLSIGLFWIRPYQFMAIDRISRPYIYDISHLEAPGDKCPGSEYAAFMASLASALKAKALNYPELAFAAWQEVHNGRAC